MFFTEWFINIHAEDATFLIMLTEIGIRMLS